MAVDKKNRIKRAVLSWLCVDIPITVAQKQLTGIVIKTAPAKTYYWDDIAAEFTALPIGSEATINLNGIPQYLTW